jgi:hypothetical protein
MHNKKGRRMSYSAKYTNENFVEVSTCTAILHSCVALLCNDNFTEQDHLPQKNVSVTLMVCSFFCYLHNMTLRLLYLFIFISAFQGNKSTVTKWVIMSGCYLKVDGSTNINKFSCAITNYSIPDTILVGRNTKPLPLNGNIRLDVQNFDCHNIIMTADLRKTLKASTFPKLVIRFLSINKYPDIAGKEIIKGMVNIELAGVSKQFDVDYTVASADKSVINLIGTRRVNFSDFSITPPRKLGGMIKTNNELDVMFNIRMKVL